MSDDDTERGSLHVENAALRKGFTLIPNVVLRARGLSRDAKLLYGVLLSYAWQTDQCFPGYDRLQEDLQCGRPQLAKYIKELRDCGLITVQRRGQGLTSLYTLSDKFQNETSRSFAHGSSSSSETKLLEVSKRNRKKDSEEEYAATGEERVTENALTWQTVLASLATKTTAANYQTYLATTRLVDLTLLEAVVAVPQDFQRQWLAGRWPKVIEKALEQVLQRRVGVRFVVG